MRIISGTHRGRPLLSPPASTRRRQSATTRPITDRVKQSLFDRLSAMGCFAADAHEPAATQALDVFAGTGSLGLEALSRGVGYCTFLERDRSARALLEQNLSRFGWQERATVRGGDALAAGWIDQRMHKSINVIFCDPPYALWSVTTGLRGVTSLIHWLSAVVATDGVLMLRTPAGVPPVDADCWQGPATHRYGSMALHFYHPHLSVQS